MRIVDMMARCGQFLSLEFFPPKEKDKWPAFFAEVERLKALNPALCLRDLRRGRLNAGLHPGNRHQAQTRLQPWSPWRISPAWARARIPSRASFSSLEKAEVHNVLALRGDPPQGQDSFVPDNEDFQHASDLVSFIDREFPGLGVGVACYPEKHQEGREPGPGHRVPQAETGQGRGLRGLPTSSSTTATTSISWSGPRKQGIDKPIIPASCPCWARGPSSAP